ncbi:uncharacterized protein PAC_15792 [Phialocephala subalpina]|uniref:Uncharacterized protein n=1 Tax=Phialocephala subalpina TaxID=576137 RepID=A0A1L7XLI2_9HELO|nr:uncharacterized protein PAC_15792 [Phialocephala subalpina]
MVRAPYAGQTVRDYFETLTTNPFTLQFKPQTLIPPPAPSTAGNIGAYNNELDFDATLSLNADGTRNSTGPQRNAFQTYFAAEYTDPDEVRDHNNVIQAFHEVVDYIRRNRAGCPLAAVAPAAKRDLLYLENRDLLIDDSIMGNRFQSHLVPMDVKFKKMDVVIPEQPFGHLLRMRAVSV